MSHNLGCFLKKVHFCIINELNLPYKNKAGKYCPEKLL
jgi:hypothetical protein